MDDDARRAELRAFLVSRRARVRPEDVGLPSGGRRRVPGLRREEVASLAGVGVTWYTMFETGVAQGVSREVVAGVARALRLSPAEQSYLSTLAEGVARPTGDLVVDSLALRALHDWVDAPAYVITTTWDIIAWNDAFACVWGIAAAHQAPFNVVLRTFVDPAVRAMHGPAWESFASALVAMFRAGWGGHAGDPRYAALLDTLREDADFGALWRRHDVSHPLEITRGAIVSPGVGPFAYEVLNLALPTSAQQTLVVQVPDAASAERLRAAMRRSRAS